MDVQQQVLDLASQSVTAAHSFIGEMRPPLSPPGRPQCALFLTIAEQYEAAVHLIVVGMPTHAAMHVRGMQEAFADLRLLGRHGDHVRRMRYNQLDGAKRMYKRMLDSDFLPDIHKIGPAEALRDMQREHAPLHEEFKKKRMTQIEAFCRAELTDLISSYTLFCSFAHNDLGALALRHQGETGMTHRSPPRLDDTFAFTYVAMSVLFRAALDLEKIVYLPEGRFDHHMSGLRRLLDQVTALSPYDDIEHGNQESRPKAAR